MEYWYKTKLKKNENGDALCIILPQDNNKKLYLSFANTLAPASKSTCAIAYNPLDEAK